MMKKTLVVGLVLSVVSAVFAAADRVEPKSSEGAAVVARNATAHTRQTSFNSGWEYRWDDEAQWSGTSVPHDAARLRGFDSSVPGGSDQGFFREGVLRYRKAFPRPSGTGRFALRFDGLYMDSTVSLNGRTVGGRRNGYVGFEVPLADLAETNLIEISLNCFTPNARWYAGAGILRNVWLVERTGFAADPDAVSVRTELKDGRAVVRISAEGLTVVSPEGGVLEIAEPRLWTPEMPNLYTLDVTVRNDAGETDVVPVRYGVRTVEFTVDRGMLLNGKPCRIKGLCQHEGSGCLGTALNLPALRRQLKGIKATGANAVRTAHHPFSPEFYALCDEMGLMVFAELLDDWKIPHRAGYHAYSKFFDECAAKDVEAFVRRDRNHPSVILWSIGNEVQEVNRPGPLAAQEAKMLYGVVKRADPTRAVTFACSDPKTATANGSLDVLDVVGLNYNADWFEKLKGKRPVFGSETAAALNSRDTYLFRPVGDRLVAVCHRNDQENSYSMGIPFVPAAPMEETHKVQMRSPWSAGEFAWCYQDYLGEGFRHDAGWLKFWPARSTYWGLVDTAGFPKDRFYFYRAMWTDIPTVRLMPDWNLAGFEGKLVPVWCYTNGEEAELFLNGRSLGVRRFADTDDLHLAWDVPYEPGKLEVRAKMKDGTVVADCRETVGKTSALRVTKECEDAGTLFLRIDAVDDEGRRVIACDSLVDLEVEGAEILSVDNGDATDLESFVHPAHRLFRGSLLAVLKRTSPQVRATFRTLGLRAAVFAESAEVVDDRTSSDPAPICVTIARKGK